MDKFEEGELKDQTLTAKSLLSKPEFKQQYFSPIQCLPDSFKTEMLQKVLDEELSLPELKEKAAEYRSQKSIQKAFCKITNTSWEEAERRFPNHTAANKLYPFASIVSTKKLPDSFIAYCQGALQSESLEANATGSSLDVFKVSGSAAYLLEGNILEMCCQDIRKVHSTFMGANLFIAHVQKVIYGLLVHFWW